MGARNRFAGTLIAVGHGIVEFPLMALLLGIGAVFEHATTQIIIDLAGGAVLLWMAYGMFRSSSQQTDTQSRAFKDKPVIAGAVLTASNPYFLIWWATVGLALATTATGFGLWAFVFFAVVHWLVDLIWMGSLSLASFHGTRLLGPKLEQIVLKICAAAMLLFGLLFIYNAGAALIRHT